MNARRIRELLSSAAIADRRDLDRVFGQLVHACAAEWKDGDEGRKLEHLEHTFDLAHSDLYRVFNGTKKLGGRLLLAPPAMLRAIARELSVLAGLTSGEMVEADVRGGNVELVIALADLQAHDSRASVDQVLTPDECRRGLELCDAVDAKVRRRRELYERGLGERGVREGSST